MDVTTGPGLALFTVCALAVLFVGLYAAALLTDCVREIRAALRTRRALRRMRHRDGGAHRAP